MKFVTFLLFLRLAFAYPTEYNSEMSFKGLESGESSGEIVNQCCQRESKYITVGHGIGGGEIRMDVGQCRQKCETPATQTLKRDEFDKYLKKYPDMDPIQIFLSLQNKNPVNGESPPSSIGDNTSYIHSSANERKSASCLQSICLPSTTKRENYYDLSGEVKEIDVIESCDCVSLPHEGCQRFHSLVKIHVDSPYEKEVDVGQCIGTCEDNSSEHCLSCAAVRNRTISVEGPNGAHCLGVIDECQCVGECFRLRHFLKVYDYTNVYEASPLMNSIGNVGNNDTILDLNESEPIPEISGTLNISSLEPLTKVIDIGRCSGTCSRVPVTSKCLLWSNATSSNGTCLSYLTGGRSKCTASKLTRHSYTDKGGKKHSIVSVTACGCN